MQSEGTRPIMDEEYWGKKLLQAVRKYMFLRDNGENVCEVDMDDLCSTEEEEENEEGMGVENDHCEEWQKEAKGLNTVAFKEKIPKGKEKRNYYLKKAAVGSPKNSNPQTSRIKKKEKIRNHRRPGIKTSEKKRSGKSWIKQQRKRRWGRSQVRKKMHIRWLPQSKIEREQCFKRRRLKTQRWMLRKD